MHANLTIGELPTSTTRLPTPLDQEGIEPSTSSMRMKRSTDELLALTSIIPY